MSCGNKLNKCLNLFKPPAEEPEEDVVQEEAPEAVVDETPSASPAGQSRAGGVVPLWILQQSNPTPPPTTPTEDVGGAVLGAEAEVVETEDTQNIIPESVQYSAPAPPAQKELKDDESEAIEEVQEVVAESPVIEDIIEPETTTGYITPVSASAGNSGFNPGWMFYAFAVVVISWLGFRFIKR